MSEVKTRIPIYDSNPFVGSLVAKTDSVEIHAGQVNLPQPDGLQPTVLLSRERVDGKAFENIYENALISMTNIGKAALKLFDFLISLPHSSPGCVELNVPSYAKDIDKSPSHIYRLLKELTEKGFIARSIVVDQYFVNHNLACKDDRFVIVKQYIRKMDSELNHEPISGTSAPQIGKGTPEW